MHKVAVMGDKASVMCFKAFGIEVFNCLEDKYEENKRTLDTLAKKDYGIIFITEQVALNIKDTIDRYDRSITPIILLIPSNKGSLGIGIKKIYDNVEKAISINILDEGR